MKNARCFSVLALLIAGCSSSAQNNGAPIASVTSQDVAAQQQDIQGKMDGAANKTSFVTREITVTPQDRNANLRLAMYLMSPDIWIPLRVDFNPDGSRHYVFRRSTPGPDTPIPTSPFAPRGAGN